MQGQTATRNPTNAAALRVASTDVEDIALDIDESYDAVMDLNQKYARYFS